MQELSHFDQAGKARMVDVTAKADTVRLATARGLVRMQPETLARVRAGEMGKGDVLGVAQIAGIMGAKRTPDLIPLCHPLPVSGVDLRIEADDHECAVQIEATVRTTGKTGVEMEALTAVSVAALTVYDMCKGVDKTMRIDAVRLVHKSGGRSGTINLE